MIPDKSRADFWIQIVSQSAGRHKIAVVILSVLAQVFDASIEDEPETSIDGDNYDFVYTILTGRQESIGVFAWLQEGVSNAEQMVDAKHPYADGYILIGPLLSNRAFSKPSRSYWPYLLDEEVRERWPQFRFELLIGDALVQLTNPTRLKERYGVTNDEWFAAVAGRNAPYFLPDDEMLLNSPCHLIYEIVADVESRNLHALGARRLNAATAYGPVTERERKENDFLRYLIAHRPKLYELR